MESSSGTEIINWRMSLLFENFERVTFEVCVSLVLKNKFAKALKVKAKSNKSDILVEIGIKNADLLIPIIFYISYQAKKFNVK